MLPSLNYKASSKKTPKGEQDWIMADCTDFPREAVLDTYKFHLFSTMVIWKISILGFPGGN